MKLTLLSLSIVNILILNWQSDCRAEGFFFPRPGRSIAKNNGECDPHCMTANVPPGTRQVCKYGKMWPPFPRTTEPQQTYQQQFHSVHYWPYPYNINDQALVDDLTHTQTINGWREATTLHVYHFNAETNELNSAGKEHLAWIVSSVPAEYRSITVAAGADGIVNDTRMNNVLGTVNYLTGNDLSVPVSLRIASPRGRPAFEVQKYQQAARDNAIPPVIQYNTVQSQSTSGQ